MIINRAYKFRLYPTEEQTILINKTLGCNRLVYNYYLNKKKELYENNKESISYFECNKDILNLEVEYPFLKEVDSMSFICSLKDLERAYKRLKNARKYNIHKITKDLNVREYTCPECGTRHDRDFNASVNIMFEGITKYFKNEYEY